VITVRRFSPAKGTRQIHQKFIGIIEIFKKYPTLFGQYSAISMGNPGENFRRVLVNVGIAQPQLMLYMNNPPI
jgi:hypothetical protein